MNDRANSVADPTNEAPEPTRHAESYEGPSLWQQNHGNLLIAFVAVVFLLGAGVLFYRQNRFIPPRFPEGDMIDTPGVLDEPKASDGKNIVTIVVAGAANNTGAMKLAVYDGEENFGNRTNAVVAETVPINNGVARLNVLHQQLPTRFAVAAYHDENRDDQLNRNQFGIPMERYGFSRDARGMTGPPDYSATEISRPAPGKQINISIR